MENLEKYIKALSQLYKTGLATEHTLRQILVDFLISLSELSKFSILNEPKRIECGAPDIVLLQKDKVPVAYIETKDIGDPDLRGLKQNKVQFTRYKQGLDCIVFTDFLRFLLYQEGECILEVEIARQDGDQLRLLEDAHERFEVLIAHLRDAQPIPITSAKKLALLMANKAQLLARSIQTVLTDKESEAGSELQTQLERMRTVLMSTVAPSEFSDWYAQTLVYGLFAARYHDENDKEFTRQKAAELIPQSNPFLRKLFQRIGVYDLDERIVWIIDDLVGVFGATDVRQLLDSSKSSEQDPVMLFYEDFLAAYDPARRKSKGVYYTPAPVVEFIVRIVDEILQRDFDLRDGLADRSMVESKSAKPAHRLQILDPATGTGTFLVQVVRKIHEKFAGREGAWNEYVREHLLPRLHGYEILMAPYAMAHLNLEYVFRETGATELGNARYG
ncbi:MAG: N-6 DNA methylase, partial [Bacteroides sp.]